MKMFSVVEDFIYIRIRNLGIDRWYQSSGNPTTQSWNLSAWCARSSIGTSVVPGVIAAPPLSQTNLSFQTSIISTANTTKKFCLSWPLLHPAGEVPESNSVLKCCKISPKSQFDSLLNTIYTKK
ncbi:uncharacterized protein [Physcomitrium patens]|uniref:Uncharacterized protein n=1 Tax=Physcomitrium patens TaxID=3218 RepID=A0A2K1J9M8_PHYPA|nr:hypothetical protein PHYPA_021342 [Physcomitrium patens]